MLLAPSIPGGCTNFFGNKEYIELYIPSIPLQKLPASGPKIWGSVQSLWVLFSLRWEVRVAGGGGKMEDEEE